MPWLKYAESATAKFSAEAVFEILGEERYKVIRCDNGSHFLRTFREELARLCEALPSGKAPEIVYGPSYRPQCQSLVEAPHRDYNHDMRIGMNYVLQSLFAERALSPLGVQTETAEGIFHIAPPELRSASAYRAVTGVGDVDDDDELGEDESDSDDGVPPSADWPRLLPAIRRSFIEKPRPAWGGYSVKEMHTGRRLAPDDQWIYQQGSRSSPIDDIGLMASTSRAAIQARNQSREAAHERRAQKAAGTYNFKPIVVGDIIMFLRPHGTKYQTKYYQRLYLALAVGMTSVDFRPLDTKPSRLISRSNAAYFVVTPMDLTGVVAYLASYGMSRAEIVEHVKMLRGLGMRCTSDPEAPKVYFGDPESGTMNIRYAYCSVDTDGTVGNRFPIANQVVVSWNCDGIAIAIRDRNVILFKIMAMWPLWVFLQETKASKATVRKHANALDILFPDYVSYWQLSEEKTGFSGLACLVHKSVKHEELWPGNFRDSPLDVPELSTVANAVIPEGKVHPEYSPARDPFREGRFQFMLDRNHKIAFWNLYNLNSMTYLRRLEMRMEWDRVFEKLVPQVQAAIPEGYRLVIIGDFNVLWDFSDEHIHPVLKSSKRRDKCGNVVNYLETPSTTREERDSFRALVQKTNLKRVPWNNDAQAQPTMVCDTDHIGKNIGLVLDYVLTTDQKFADTCAVHIVQTGRVDHQLLCLTPHTVPTFKAPDEPK